MTRALAPFALLACIACNPPVVSGEGEGEGEVQPHGEGEGEPAGEGEGEALPGHVQVTVDGVVVVLDTDVRVGRINGGNNIQAHGAGGLPSLIIGVAYGLGAQPCGGTDNINMVFHTSPDSLTGAFLSIGEGSACTVTVTSVAATPGQRFSGAFTATLDNPDGSLHRSLVAGTFDGAL